MFLMKFSQLEFARLLACNDREMVAHAICDRADDVFYSRGASAVIDPFKTVVTVETFWGEVTNGGLYQYFTNTYGAFATFAPAALEQVGLQLCAKVMKAALSLFPSEVLARDDPDYMAAIDNLTELPGEDPFIKIEQPFWEWYNDGNENTIRERLHNWILAQRYNFIEEHTSSGV